MIIEKAIILKQEDIFQMIKNYLTDKNICKPERVCNYSLKDNSIVVTIANEEIK